MTWKDKVKKEREDLEIKINKLGAFLKKNDKSKEKLVSRYQEILLHEQYETMMNYSEILRLRLNESKKKG